MTDIAKIYALAKAIMAETGIDEPVPAPTPVPQPPATPLPPEPPMTTEDLVDGLATGATPCGAPDPSTLKVVGRDPLPSGVTLTATDVVFDGFSGDFTGWDVGARGLMFLSRVGRVADIYMSGGSGSTPHIHCQPGGGFDLMEFVTSVGCAASMILKQENGGFAGVIRRCRMIGMSQDALKLSGGNLVEENLFGPATYRGGAPHTDTFTTMAAKGSIVIRNNYVDWTYAGQTDQAGINNWLRVESYKTGNVFDDIEVYGNRLHHANPTSFAIQITEKNAPVWNGTVKIRDNRMQKAGGNNKILYAPSARISEWARNVDMATGLEIPIGAA